MPKWCAEVTTVPFRSDFGRCNSHLGQMTGRTPRRGQLRAGDAATSDAITSMTTQHGANAILGARKPAPSKSKHSGVAQPGMCWHLEISSLNSRNDPPNEHSHGDRQLPVFRLAPVIARGGVAQCELRYVQLNAFSGLLTTNSNGRPERLVFIQNVELLMCKFPLSVGMARREHRRGYPPSMHTSPLLVPPGAGPLVLHPTVEP